MNIASHWQYFVQELLASRTQVESLHISSAFLFGAFQRHQFFVDKMTDMHMYVSALNHCVARQDGVTLAKLISIPVGRDVMSKQIAQLTERARHLNPVSYCASNVSDNGIAQVAGRRLACLVSMEARDWSAAYQNELASYNAILGYFKEDSAFWIIPALSRVMNDLRLLASKVSLLFLWLQYQNI